MGVLRVQHLKAKGTGNGFPAHAYNLFSVLFYFVLFPSPVAGVDDVDTLTMLIDFLLNVVASNNWLMKHCALSFLICFLALLLRQQRWMLVPAKRFSKFFVAGLSEKVVRRVALPE